jgi:hypothetical protein
MNNVIKTTALLFAALLLYISISCEYYSSPHKSPLLNTEPDNTVSFFSTEKPDLFFLNPQESRMETSTRNLPVSHLKNSINDLFFRRLFPEIRLSTLNQTYLSYSLTVDLSLSNSNIVYPFHTFW